MQQNSNISASILSSLQEQFGVSSILASTFTGTTIIITPKGVCMHISSTHFCHSGYLCLS